MSNELKRTYNIPLRKEYLKVAYYKRSKKAVTALKQFVKKHMKIDNMENVLIGKYLNEEIWKRGISNPPHHVHVNILKDIKENKALVELFDKPIAFEKKKEAKKEGKSEGAKEKIKEKLGLKEDKKDKGSGSKDTGIEGKIGSKELKEDKKEKKKKETPEEKAEKVMEHVKEREHEQQEKADEIEKEEIKEMKKELPKTHHHIPKTEDKEKRIEPHQQGPMHL